MFGLKDTCRVNCQNVVIYGNLKKHIKKNIKLSGCRQFIESIVENTEPFIITSEPEVTVSIVISFVSSIAINSLGNDLMPAAQGN